MAFLSVNGIIALLYLGTVVARRRALVTAPRVELRGVGHAYGGRVVLAGVERVLEPGPRARPAGPERQRQVDAAALHRGPAAPARGHGARRRARELRAGAAPSARASPTPGTGRCSGAGSARARTCVLCAGLYGLGAETRRARARGGRTSRRRPSARPRRSRRASASGSRSRARCCPRPSLLVLDEPHSGLDEASGARLDALLAEARGERRRSCSRRTSARAPSGCATSCCSWRCCAERAAPCRSPAPCGLLVRTDLVLERRAPQLALAMGLFAAVAQVVLHYGADIAQPAGRA